MKRIISLFLALILAAGCFTLPGFAYDEPDAQASEAVVETVVQDSEADADLGAAGQNEADAAGLPDEQPGEENDGDGQPAADPDDHPDDPAGGDGDPAAVPADESDETEQAAPFERGYARVAGDTPVYDAAGGREIGRMTARSTVYAIVESRNEDGTAKWYRVVFDTRAANEAGQGLGSGYVRGGAVSVLTDGQIADLNSEMDAYSGSPALREYAGLRLPFASFRAAEEELPDEGTPEDQGDQPEEEPPVRSAVTVVATPNRASAFSGDAITITAAVKNTSGTVTYKWLRSTDGENWGGTTLTGNGTNTLSFDATAARLAYQYCCKVTDSNGVWYSNAVSIRFIDTKPTVTVTANRASYIAGASVVLTAAAQNTSGSLTYRWERSQDGVTWSGTTLSGNSTKKLTFEASATRLAYQYRCRVTDDNGSWYSSGIDLPLVPTPTVTASANRSTALTGSAIVLTAAAENTAGTVTYKWLRSTDGENWSGTTLSGYNTNKLSFDANEARLAYQYRCKVTDDNGSWYSSAVQVTWLPTPTVAASASRDAAFTGDPVSFTASAKDTQGALTYRWQRSLDGEAWSNTTLSGYNTKTLSFEASKDRLSYQYRCKVTDDNGSWYSNSVTVRLNPTVTASAASASVVNTTAAVITVSVIGASGTVSYRWQRSEDGSAWSNTTLNGYNTNKLSFDANEARLAYMYRCKVTDDNGAWYSNSVKLTLLPSPTVTAAAAKATAFAGDAVTITAAVKDAHGALTYKWQKSTDGETWSSTTLTGCNTNTLSFEANSSRLACRYRCKVTDDNGVWYSNSVTVKLLPTPTVTLSPSGVNAVDGTKATITAAAANTVGALKYEWQQSANNASWSKTYVSGYTTDTVTMNATSAQLGYYFRCAVTDDNGTWYSDSFKFNWVPKPTVTLTPNRTSAVIGNAITISAACKNTMGDVSYQWQKSADGNTWVNTTLAGCKTDTLSFTATEDRLSFRYRCRVTDDNGAWFSSALKITQLPTPIVTVSTNTASAFTDDTVAFTAGTKNMSGAVTYQWQRSTDGSSWSSTTLDGNKTYKLSFKASEARLSYYYRCKVTDNNGTWYSDKASITWKRKPILTISANRSIATADDDIVITLTVADATGPVTYRWQRSTDGNSFSDVPTSLTGCDGAVLSFSATQTLLNYRYRCKVTDSNGIWYSDPIKVQWHAPAAITAKANKATAFSGDDIIFSVTASNTSGTLTYKWQRSADGVTWTGTTLDGNATSKLTFSATETRLSYCYRCVVTDSYGPWYSNAVCVTWLPTPVITAKPNRSSAGQGDSVVFTATAANTVGSLTYRWQRSANGTSWTSIDSSFGLSGYNTSQLSFSATSSLLGYQYRCSVKDNNGTWYSNAVSVSFVQTRYVALLVGNGTGYVHLNSLQGPSKDVAALSTALKNLSPAFEVTVIQNKMADQIVSAINSTFSGTTSNDVCLFYYSGHGDNGYDSTAGSLCGINCDPDTNSDMLKPSRLASALNSACGGKVIVLLDSCGSGASIYSRNGTAAVRPKLSNFTSAAVGAFGGYTFTQETTDPDNPSKTGELRTNKFIVIAACKYGEVSSDAVYINGSTIRVGCFTYWLLQSMGCSHPGGTYNGSYMYGDSNRNNQLTLNESYNYITTQLAAMRQNFLNAVGDPELAQEIIDYYEEHYSDFIAQLQADGFTYDQCIAIINGSLQDDLEYATDYFTQTTQKYGDGNFVLFQHK